jgi:uncharacterized protein YecE (DUF72 family)
MERAMAAGERMDPMVSRSTRRVNRPRPRAIMGTSGWSYPHWRGAFFPKGLPAKRHLAYIAERFPTVEVNRSFYRLLTPDVVDGWRREVPGDFIFAVKGSRYITHMRKLSGGLAPIANFFAMGVLRFGAQLGPILWQLPSSVRFRADRADAFFASLPRDLRAAETLARRHHDDRVEGRAAFRAPDGRERPIRYALEVRDPSWLEPEALALLRRHGIALAAAETAGLYPLSFERTARDFAYVRLHGARELYASRYTDEELDA